MLNFRQFEVGPDPFGRKWQVLFKWLQTAISLRHSDTVDVKFILESDGTRVQKVQVTIVMPRACPDCEAPIGLTHRCERGVKCEMLKARFACQSCDYARDISFCVPVFA